MSTANNEESSDTFSTQLSRERENNQHRTKQICSPRLTIMSTANNQESSDTFRAQLASERARKESMSNQTNHPRC
eukprot:scaffold22293_cov54-Cyclotella_meneghiniana.AAC.1